MSESEFDNLVQKSEVIEKYEFTLSHLLSLHIKGTVFFHVPKILTPFNVILFKDSGHRTITEDGCH